MKCILCLTDEWNMVIRKNEHMVALENQTNGLEEMMFSQENKTLKETVNQAEWLIRPRRLL